MILFKQPLADAVYYKNQDVIKLLEKYGSKYGSKPPVFINLVPAAISLICWVCFYMIKCIFMFKKSIFFDFR